MTQSFITLHRSNRNQSIGPFDASGIDSTDPLSSSRKLAYQNDDGTAVGVVNFKGSLRSHSFPHSELLVLTRGTLSLTVDASQLTLSAGAAAVISKGAKVVLNSDLGADWVFFAVSSENSHSPELANITLLDTAAALIPSGAPGADILISETPSCRRHELFNRTDQQFRAGLWDSTPYERKVLPHKDHELMHILQGSVTLTAADGRSEIYSAGDTVFVPAGTECAWKSDVQVAKIYCIRGN